jgi:hypothetical protein
MAFMEYDLNPPASPLMWPRSALVDQLVPDPPETTVSN